MPKMMLDKGSSEQEIDNWIGQCIRMARREGKDAKEAAGMCYGMAREATGKELGYKGKGK